MSIFDLKYKNTEFWSPFKMPECQLLTKKNRYQNAYLLVQIRNAKMPAFDHTKQMSKSLILAAKIKCRKSQFLTSQIKCQNPRFLTYDHIDEMPKCQNPRFLTHDHIDEMPKCQNPRFLTYDYIDEMPKCQNVKMPKCQLLV
jgi:hypothetical protein